MTNLYIVDDHSLFREGMRFLLSQIKGISVTGEASNGKELLEKLSEDKLPDLILMDINMPVMDGVEACNVATERYPDIKIVALSMNDGPEYYTKMIQAGAKGFVQKQATKDELKKAITEVMNGGSYFPEEMLRKLIFRLGKAVEQGPGKSYGLTNRELEVLEMICQGYTNAEIAEKLFLSPKTIEGYRANLLVKTETKNSAHLVMFSIKHGIIKV
jgi:DNA-binding NarL/FixJ family response regulator